MEKSSRSISVYMQKIKHLGIWWATYRIWNKILDKVFRIRDRTLSIVRLDLKGIPIMDAKLEGVKYSFLTENDIDKIVNLNFIEMTKEIVERDFKKGSECLGAFLNNKLIGCSWIHHSERNFPFFDYTLIMKDDEAYSGPAYVIPEYRGNWINEALMTRQAVLFRDEKNYKYGYGSVMKDNLASQKAVQRTGVKPLREIRVIKFFDYIIYKKEKEIHQ